MLLSEDNLSCEEKSCVGSPSQLIKKQGKTLTPNKSDIQTKARDQKDSHGPEKTNVDISFNYRRSNGLTSHHNNVSMLGFLISHCLRSEGVVGEPQNTIANEFH